MSLSGVSGAYEVATVALSREERAALAAVLAYELAYGPPLGRTDRALADAFVEELQDSAGRAAMAPLGSVDVPLALQPVIATAAFGLWERLCDAERGELVRLVRLREQALAHRDGAALRQADTAWAAYISAKLGDADPRRAPYPGLEQPVERVWLTIGRVAAALEVADQLAKLRRRLEDLDRAAAAGKRPRRARWWPLPWPWRRAPG
jgi:hypothetical protein